jgi:hypothetical protein
MFEKLLLKI